jgi:glycosyltransferase involved in cell wall biosynthesis
MAQAVADDDVRARLIEAGRERAARYSWERCADGLVAVYGKAATTR